MNDDKPLPAAYYDQENIWTPAPTVVDNLVCDIFASGVADLLQVLDDSKPKLSRDVYARLFASLRDMSRLLGEYEDRWNGT